MKHLGRFMAVLTALLFIATLPCATWMFSTGQMLLNADSYKNAFSQQNVYADLIPALLPAIAESENRDNVQNPDTLTFLNIVGNLDANDWRRIAAELVPPEWLRAQVEANLDAWFAWLNGQQPAPAIQFDTGALRERLSGPPGQRAVNLIMESWPPCTEEQLNTLLNFDASSQEAFPFCQPPGEYLALTSEALAETLRQQARRLPDVFPNPAWLLNDQTRTRLNQIKLSVRLAQTVVTEVWLLAAALVSLTVFFTVRSLKSFGRWCGLLLTVGGIAAVLPIPFLLSPFLLPPALAAAVSPGAGGPGSPASGPGLGEAGTYLELMIQGVTRSLMGEIMVPVLMLAAVMIGLGLLALVISALVRYPDEIPARDRTTATPPASALTPTGPITPTGQMAPQREQPPPEPPHRPDDQT